MWLLGGIGTWLKIAQLAWMWGDREIMIGCLPIGLSIGIFIRINNFFPDIRPATSLNNPSLTDLLANPTALPINSQTVYIRQDPRALPRERYIPRRAFQHRRLALRPRGGVVFRQHVPRAATAVLRACCSFTASVWVLLHGVLPWRRSCEGRYVYSQAAANGQD